MDKPTCSNEEALRQAGETADQYMKQAIKSIDAVFHDGYAKSNPQLLASHMLAQAIDFGTTAVTAALYERSV